jgi:hypothetical protein
VRRHFAAFIVLALTLPSLAMMASSARASCCCKASGMCPLRKHGDCEKSCSMSGSEAAPVSTLSREPAVFADTSMAFAIFSSELVSVVFPTPLRRATPPALPPPRA